LRLRVHHVNKNKAMRKSLIPILLLVVFGLFQSCNCGTDPTPSTPIGDTTNIFSRMSVKFVAGSPAFSPNMGVQIDSAGHPLSIQKGDTLTCNGFEIPGVDSLHVWGDGLREVVDSGAYVFTWSRGAGPAQIKASFSIVLQPFDITAPEQGALVDPSTGLNDTVRYTKSSATTVWGYYANSSDTRHAIGENGGADNGTYEIMDLSSAVPRGNGFVYVMRHFVGTLASPAPFKKVSYDYWQSSQHIKLNFNW
jgi:hypothetical protein